MTPYSVVYDAFKFTIIRDTTLDGTIPDDMMDMRMFKLLKKGISKMYMTKDNRSMPLNFVSISDDVLMCFKEELNQIEIELVASFMYQCYLEEKSIERINALKANSFSDDEIKSFSGAEMLDKYLKALDKVKLENKDMIIQYKWLDRKTLEYKKPSFIFD